MLNVVFLWHMHQPYYVDPLTKTAMMPWVRLHAVRGYLDMIDVVSHYPELRVNFNFTPVLVQQLEEFSHGEIIDKWGVLSRRPAELLESWEKSEILENFFKINWSTLIEPFPRYRELLELRGREWNLKTIQESVGHFTPQDFLDLQVWYNLAWCGFSAFKRYPELGQLRDKGRNFTEAEKNRLMDIHLEIIRMVLGLYRQAQEETRVEITTTPYFHPIMPLVYDSSFAGRCMPGRELPPRFSAQEDVRAHLRASQQLHTKIFGRPARGLWPSEGSVAPELMPLFKEAGIEYFCTDEDILFRSLSQDPAHNSRKADHLELFQPWASEYDGARIGAMFRERPLSDFIGFNAARNTAKDAAEYIVYHLEHIAEIAKHPHPTVCLALDGENAWEAFHDGGEAFLHLMYRRILESSRLVTRRLGDLFDEVKEPPVIYRLHTGSWIRGDFDIWIGDPEENRAWEWLGKTRAFLVEQSQGGGHPEEVLNQAWKEIYAAEGSDWFWWYGPDFQTDCDLLFDALFRQHLQNVYHILKVVPPQYLGVPIRTRGQVIPFTKPSAYIYPQIDGSEGGYYDWLGAGVFDVKRQQTAMFQSNRVCREIAFGINEKQFVLRLDYEKQAPGKIHIAFCRPTDCRVVLTKTTKGYEALLETSQDALNYKTVDGVLKVAEGTQIEIGVPLASLGYEVEGSPIAFMVQIYQEGVETERYPERGLIEFDGPSSQFQLANWFV